jgi:hypothetical protein
LGAESFPSRCSCPRRGTSARHGRTRVGPTLVVNPSPRLAPGFRMRMDVLRLISCPRACSVCTGLCPSDRRALINPRRSRGGGPSRQHRPVEQLLLRLSQVPTFGVKRTCRPSSPPWLKPLSTWTKTATKTATNGWRGSFAWYLILRGVKCPNPNLRGFSVPNPILRGVMWTSFPSNDADLCGAYAVYCGASRLHPELHPIYASTGKP